MTASEGASNSSQDDVLTTEPPLAPGELAASLAIAARKASHALASASGAVKNDVLKRLAGKLRAHAADLQAENQKDLALAESAGIGSANLDRLKLTPARIEAMPRASRRSSRCPIRSARSRTSRCAPTASRSGACGFHSG